MMSRFGIIHQGRMVQEMSATELDRLRGKHLWVESHHQEAARAALANAGYTVQLSESGALEVTSEQAIRHPERIAKLLVQADLPPTLLKVEEEDLESYFLRTIGGIGGASQ